MKLSFNDIEEVEDDPVVVRMPKKPRKNVEQTKKHNKNDGFNDMRREKEIQRESMLATVQDLDYLVYNLNEEE